MRALVQSRTLEVLWDAEARGALGEYEFTRYRLSMWAYVRWLAALYLGDRFYGSSLVDCIATGPTTLRGKAAYVAESVYRHPRWRVERPSPISFICSSVGNYPRNGRYFNRLTDYFTGCFPEQTFLLEHSDARVFHTPRQFPQVAHHDGILVEAALEAQLRRESADDRSKCDAFVARLRELLGAHLGDDFFQLARNQLTKCVTRVESWRRQYLALFDRLQPRLLLIEDACYGGYSHIVRWARERGIATAEFQHGYIGTNHEAYNYAPPLIAGRYRDNFPDYFLFYGRHWSEQVNIPSEVVLIGNPHLTELTRNLRRQSAAPSVLFVSGALDVEYYRQILPAIAGGLPAGTTLRFRPHPEERAATEARYGDLFARHGIVIDREPLAYQSVIDADLIIGDASTLLFEADALGKPVALLDYEQSHKAIPPGLFPFVDDWSTIGTLIAGAAARTSAARAELWTPGWEANYRTFINRILAPGLG